MLQLPDFYDLQHVAALTQLTHLELDGGNSLQLQEPGGGPGLPLAGMQNLVSLKLLRTDLGAAQPCPFPPHLTRLELAFCWTDTMALGPHLVQCQQLQELHLEGDGYSHSDKCEGSARYSLETHPTLLLQALAGQLTGLQKLHLSDWQDMPIMRAPKVLTAVTRRMLKKARMGGQERVEEWVPVTPLTAARGATERQTTVMMPPPNMGALTSLQHLSTPGWWLVVSSDRYWRALAGCSSLRSLEELHASAPPPAGVTFPHLTRLDVTTSTSPGDTVTLLGAFPELRELELKMFAVCPPDGQVSGVCAVTLHSVMLHVRHWHWTS
jgi:hypothetical protein